MTAAEQQASAIGTKIDLSKVLEKVSQNLGWDPPKQDYAYKWYLRYLALCKIHSGRYIAAISFSADELWHQHIIDTQKYHDDCLTIFGKFLKHQPIYGPPSHAEQLIYNDTVALYQLEFSELPTDMRVTSGNYSYGTLSRTFPT